MPTSIITRPATSGDLPEISNLHARVFGPGRYARSAYRVREGKGLMTRFCRVAVDQDKIVAALRMTDVTIGKISGAALLGPIAVDPAHHGQGFGRKLIAEAIQSARDAGLRLIVLVGDEPYYGRLGFKLVPHGHITFPGPVNPSRILAIELKPGALSQVRGLIVAVQPPQA
ncbi:MAG: GNAT family N-acetyltransferase [Hyphomicrobium sp.]|nr:MAG: GNAT family N-acetyltransferase [Hyphomicrobium sp.]